MHACVFYFKSCEAGVRLLSQANILSINSPDMVLAGPSSLHFYFSNIGEFSRNQTPQICDSMSEVMFLSNSLKYLILAPYRCIFQVLAVFTTAAMNFGGEQVVNRNFPISEFMKNRTEISLSFLLSVGGAHTHADIIKK